MAYRNRGSKEAYRAFVAVATAVLVATVLCILLSWH